MATIDEANAHSAALMSEMMGRWDDYMTQQQEQFGVLQAKQEGAQIAQTGFSQANKEANDSLFYASEWQKCVNKEEQNSHAQALGFDAPNAHTGMRSELYTDNSETDWSWLKPAENPFNGNPTDKAEEAQDLAQTTL